MAAHSGKGTWRMGKYTKEDIIRLVKEEDIQFIRMQFTDVFGTLKNVAITASQIEKAVNNQIMIDGSSIEGFVRIQESDQYLHPDLDSFVIFPWRPSPGKVARLICSVYNPDGTPFVTEFWDGLGSYLDFTNPDAFAFWAEKVRETLLDLGVVATWNDNNEFDIRDCDAVACGFGGEKVQASRIRPILTYLMVAASYQAQVGKNPHLRPFLSTRSGNIAVRRLAQTWSGDNRTDFADLRYCHNIGLTMSLSGLSFYGHDLGGFHGDMPSRELLLRWLQHGVFEPRFTVHSWNADGSATMPWSYPDCMPAVQALFRQRKQLLPYLYSCAYNAVEKEIPMNAPPLLYYDDKELYKQNDGMLVGKDLLVYFAFDEGQTAVNAYLPNGENWYLDGKIYAGGQSVSLTVLPTDKMPYFVRCGSVIPTDEGETVFTVYPVKSGAFTSEFFTDDGETFAYQNNRCVHLHFTVRCTENTITVSYKNTGDMPFAPCIHLCNGDSRTLSVFKEE